MNADLITGWQLHQVGRFADAARCYHTVLAGQPDHAGALHLFGVLHHQNGYSARAVELIGRAVALEPETAAYHANLAEAHRALGQHQQAIDCCRTALRLRPDYPEAANNLGLALHALGRFAEAVAQFHAALELGADFALVENNLGTSLRELGRFGEALQAYRLAVALDPELAPARSNLGQLLVEEGEAEEGLTHCAAAVRLQPGVPAFYNNLGNANRVLERLSEARAAYDEALRLASRASLPPGELAQVHANRGLALFLEGNHADAFACFHRAVELAPDDGAIWQYLANAHAAAEDHVAALSCWQRVVELNPTLAMAHNNLGWALQQEGRFPEAAACYRRALELDQDYVDARLNQGGLHEELGAMDEAEACYRRAQTLHPRAPGPLARLAVLLRGKLPETDLDAIRRSSAPVERIANLCHDPCRPVRRRGPLLFGMAHVLDARGDYAACRRLPGRGQCPGPGTATQGRQKVRPCRALGAGRSDHRRLHAATVRPPGRGRRRHAHAGVRLRHAALRHDPGRAGAGQPFAGSRRRRARSGRGPVRVDPRLARPARRHAPLPGGPRRGGRARAVPAPPRWTERDPPGDLAAAGPGRGQDAGQLSVSGLAGALVSPGDVHPRAPRPARRGGLVLDDQFPQHSLGRRSRSTSPAAAAITGG